MNKIGKKLLAITLCFILCMGLCACGGETSKVTENGDNEGTIELEFWVTYGTTGQNGMQPMVDAFNASQSDYYVVMSNNGSENQIRTKLESLKLEDYPALICGTPITNCYYDSVDYIAPLQDFMDADDEDWFSDIYESIQTLYKNSDGDVLGYPNGVSCSGWFVNVEMLAEAGYKVSDLTSYEKIVEVANAVVNKGIAQYGVSYYTSGIEMYDMLILQGLDMVNNGNGYDSPATESLIKKGTDTYEGVKKVCSLFANTYAKKLAVPYGTTSNQCVTLFTSEKSAIFYGTNSWICHILDGNPSFEYAFVPSVGINDNAKYAGQVIPEGTGFYIVNNENQKKMQGAYEFIKFMAQPENQAAWCAAMGYVPNTEAAAAETTWIEWKNKNFTTADDLIEKIKASSADVRTPYVEFTDKLLGVTTSLFGELAINPSADFDTCIDDATYSLDASIKNWVKKR